MGDWSKLYLELKASYYNIIRVFLSVSGLWPFHTRSRRYVIYFAMVMILGPGFISQILGIIEIWHDTFEVLDAVPTLCYTILTINKVLCTIYALPRVKKLLTMMQAYYFSLKSDEETKILNSHALNGRKLGYAYTGFLLGHSVIYLTSTLLAKIFTESNGTGGSSKVSNAQVGLPHRVNYMVDLDTYFVPIFIHSAICDFINTFLIVVVDVLYLTVVEYCCGLFAALRYRLETALVFQNKLTTTKDNSYSNIVYSIRRHVETMQCVAIVESIYSLSLFIQMGMIVLLISLVGYQVINNTENISHLLKPVAYLNGLLINVFFENWQGQKIIDSSEKVFESAYNAEWYDMPIAERKFLIMMMMRTEKPSMLRLCKMVVLSYVTFNTVLRTSSSYFMLLRSL